jgi:HEAT repeat protein
MAREVAIAAKPDIDALLASRRAADRVLGIRSIATAALGRYADQMAACIVDTDEVVRSEAIDVCGHATGKVRAKIAAALACLIDPSASAATSTRDSSTRDSSTRDSSTRDSSSTDVRAAAVDGLRALKLPLADARLAACLRDPDPQVRAAAARSVLTTCLPDVGAALVACLADPDARVRAASLDAVARCSTLHRPSLVAPLQALVQRHDGDTRAAVYLLGKLHEADRDGVIATWRACEHGARSDVARAATLVLGQMKVQPSNGPVEVRMLRAARELASTEKETQLAGLFEAARLGEDARPLVPAIKRLGEEVVAADVLAKVQDVLGELGVPPAELPKPRAALAAWRGIAPRERAVHGAYAIASVRELGIGVWDRATGALLFVVEGAELLEVLPGRAEVGVLRVAEEEWRFERYVVPSGERVASLVIPEALAYGWPSSLAVAGGLVTVWCGDEDEPYRFHIKLGDPDRLLDDEPSLGKRGRNRKRERGGPKRPPRSTKPRHA